jgi:hypothetical protein
MRAAGGSRRRTRASVCVFLVAVRSQVLAVTAITIANGGDYLGAYSGMKIVWRGNV